MFLEYPPCFRVALFFTFGSPLPPRPLLSAFFSLPQACYDSVGATATKWLNVIDTQGEGMSEEALLELLAEQNNMSRPLQSYMDAKQKSAAITTAKRLAAFLDPDIGAEPGLACTYVIASSPPDAPITERALPVLAFAAAPDVRMRLLSKWLRDGTKAAAPLAELLDWSYYRGRLASAILKIVTIPAALQLVDNPVPSVVYPEWLVKRVRELKDARKQTSITAYFSKRPPAAAAPVGPGGVSGTPLRKRITAGTGGGVRGARLVRRVTLKTPPRRGRWVARPPARG